MYRLFNGTQHELEHYHFPASFNGRTDIKDSLERKGYGFHHTPCLLSLYFVQR